MKAFIIGGSRNIGYYAAQRLLASGSTVTFLLRNPNVFDNDASIKQYTDSGKVRIAKGDALKEEDIKKAWDVAAEGDGPLDVVLFTVGGTPKFSATKGFVINPPNLCCASMLNLLSVYHSHITTSPTSPQPKLILISSTGLTRMSHDALPLLLKPLYGYLLRSPHIDKVGMERAVAHTAGWTWEEEEPKSEIVGEGWKERVGEAGWLKEVCVVRPALLTDGECKADKEPGKKNKEPYRAELKEVESGYTVSRRDIAHFVVERALKEWDTWNGKCVRVAY